MSKIQVNERLALIAAAALAAACAQGPAEENEPIEYGSTSSQVTEASAPNPLQASVTTPEDGAPAATPVAAPATEADAGIDVAYFNTEEFNRELAGSFLRRSNSEPDLTENEIELLQDVFGLIKAGKRERARAKLERENEQYETPTQNYLIAQLDFESAKAALDEGETERADELYDRAVRYYEAALEEFPNYLNAHHYLALVHFQRERYRQAAEHFSAELRLGGVDKLTFGLLGISLLNEEQYLPADTAFRNALMLDPFNQQWSIGLAKALFKQQRYGEAATLVGGMLKESPDSAELWLLQGNAYVGLQQPERAAENFRIAEALGGATPQSLDLMADIYANKGLHGLASETYLRAIDRSSAPSPDRAIRSARMMTQSGAVASARTLLDGVTQKLGDGLSDEQRDAILKLRSKIAVAEGNSEDEIATLSEIVARNPLDGEAFVMLGKAYDRAEQFEEAAQAFETAAEIDGSGASAKLEHGQMLVRRGDYQGAVTLIEASLQLSENDNVREYLDAVKKAARRAVK